MTTIFQNKSQKLLLLLLVFKMNPKTTTYITTFQNESDFFGAGKIKIRFSLKSSSISSSFGIHFEK